MNITAITKAAKTGKGFYRTRHNGLEFNGEFVTNEHLTPAAESLGIEVDALRTRLTSDAFARQEAKQSEMTSTEIFDAIREALSKAGLSPYPNDPIDIRAMRVKVARAIIDITHDLQINITSNTHGSILMSRKDIDVKLREPRLAGIFQGFVDALKWEYHLNEKDEGLKLMNVFRSQLRIY